MSVALRGRARWLTGDAWRVGLLFACVYTLSIGGGFYGSDGEVMFQTTAALVARGEWTLPPDPALPQIVPGAAGRYYGKYEPGLPLLSVPFYALGDWFGRVNDAHRTTLAAIFTLLLPALAGALTVVLLYGIAERVAGRRRALWVVLAAGLATPLWVYARTLFADALLALALTGAVAALSAGPPRSRDRVRPLLAGALWGMGCAVRAALAVYALPLAALVVVATPRPRWPAALGRLAALAAGPLPFVLLVLGHNQLRFDDPLRFGYAGEGFTTPVWEGVAGLLLSPGKSVLVYAPPLTVALLLWARWRRAQPSTGLFLALAWAVALPFYRAWWAWGGGWSWGPRLLAPLLPLSCLPLSALPPGRCWWAALWALIALGAAIQLLGVLTDVTPHYAALAAGPARAELQIHFALGDAPLLGALRRLSRGATEPLAVFHLADSGLPRPWTYGTPALLVAGAVLGGWWLARALRSTRSPDPARPY